MSVISDALGGGAGEELKHHREHEVVGEGDADVETARSRTRAAAPQSGARCGTGRSDERPQLVNDVGIAMSNAVRTTA